jgi:hypothetical protein
MINTEEECMLVNHFKILLFICSFVRMEGLEPPHLAASDPKSDVSTNSTTPGLIRRSLCEGGYLHTKYLNLKYQFQLEQMGFGICPLGFSIWAANVRHFAHRSG